MKNRMDPNMDQINPNIYGHLDGGKKTLPIQVRWGKADYLIINSNTYIFNQEMVSLILSLHFSPKF